MLKRIVTFLLALVMVLSMGLMNPFPKANAASDSNVTWTLADDGTLTISGEGDMPSGWDFSPPWRQMTADITRIVIEDGVTSISQAAFVECDMVTEVSIGAGVKNIGLGAFMYCVSLEEIEIPAGVTSIDSNAFMECWSLRSVTLHEGLESIGYSAFRSCNLQEITIPASVNYMGTYAISYCTNLTSVTFLGDAPVMEQPVFQGVTATVFYPGINTTWTADVMQDYEYAEITWVPYGDVVLRIIQQPESVTANPNDTVTFSTKAIGEDLTYQWQWRKNESGTWATTTVAGNKTDTITVSATAARNGYQYRCKITDGNGETVYSEGATLTVKPIETVASGEWGQDGANVRWKLDNAGTMTIYGTGAMEDCYLYNIDRYGEHWYRVWDEYQQDIKTVIIKEGITHIGNESFSSAQNLKKVTIADSVKTIGYRAFAHCDSLVEVNMGNGLVKADIEVFLDCDALETFRFPNTDTEYGNHFLAKCDKLKNVYISEKMTDIHGGMFAYCISLESIVIPDTITKLGGKAFYGCTKLKEITIPESITKIESETFAHCDSLQSITLPNSLKEMGNNVFEDCSSLKTVTVPANVSKMADTFERAYGLESVKFLGNSPICASDLFGNITITAYYPSNNKSWTENARQDYGGHVTWVSYESDIIPNNTIANGMCGDNVTWKLRNDLTLVISGSGSMYNYRYDAPWSDYVSKIEHVIVESGVTHIGKYAFIECRALKSATIANTVAWIGDAAFYNCVKLEKLEIPASVKTIENDAFSGCIGLQYIKFLGNAPQFDEIVFREITTTAYYPLGNETWTESVMQDYHGEITWVPYGDVELKITAQPENVTANLNDTVTFAVEATGEGLKYQWQWRKNENGTWASTTVSGNKTDTISVAATAARNGYQYRCKITDGNGEVVYSDAATLKVKSGIKITAQCTSVTANEGSVVTFTVKATGINLTYQWQWRKNGDGEWATTTVSGNKTDTITVSATAARNGYQYRCVVTDGNGNKASSSAATLTVKKGLIITSQPESVTAKLNDAVSFTVRASGSGLKYQWQYRSSASGKWNATTLTGAKTATLKATATNARNGYQYRCIITDAAGNQIISEAATLTIKADDGLAITAQPESVSAKLNDTVSFTVKATGDGLKYQWEYRGSANGTWKTTTLTGAKTATLKVTASNARNGFQYRCVVTDSSSKTITSNAVTLTVE